MAKKSTKEQAPAYPAGMIHTVELPELFYQLSTNVHRISNCQAVNMADQEWNGNLSWFASCAAAQFGNWDAPAIKSLTLPTLTQESDEMRYFYDVCGDILDIPSFVTEEPEQWIVAEPERKPCGRIIRLAVELGGSGNVSAREMANRGEAIIALVNSLELAGHSVEVSIVRAFHNANRDKYKFLIPVKHAGQAIDIKRLQFMLGHPAFYRRCLFGLTELAQGKNMGDCTTWTENYKPDGFLHIPHEAGRTNTLAESLAWAQQLAAELAAAN